MLAAEGEFITSDFAGIDNFWPSSSFLPPVKMFGILELELYPLLRNLSELAAGAGIWSFWISIMDFESPGREWYFSFSCE